MQSMRVGIARLPGTLKAASARLTLFAALLAVAAIAASLLHTGVHAQAVASVASSSSQPAPQSPAGAAATDPNQEIGQLLQMATELKTAVAKTNQEMLSIAVVRKAAAIEQLAHKVRTGGGAK